MACGKWLMSIAAALLFATLSQADAWAESHYGAPDSIVVRETGGTFKGKGTDERFPKELVIDTPAGESVTLRALGSGVRKKFLFKVYEGIVYVDADAFLPADPYETLIEGHFAKRFVMYFLRTVSADQIRGAWEESLTSEPADAQATADNSAFLSYFDSEIAEGATIELTWLPGSGLYTVVAGRRKAVIDSPALAARLFAIWFGDKPVSGGLKKDLIRFTTQDTP